MSSVVVAARIIRQSRLPANGMSLQKRRLRWLVAHQRHLHSVALHLSGVRIIGRVDVAHGERGVINLLA